MKRKQLSKKTRFEVFKRDNFTCQYCGQMAPDVILEVDHINPVADGGNNEMLNLITACRDCNRGKGKTLLSDDAVIKKEQKQIELMAEKREQYEMLLAWKQELTMLMDMQVDAIESIICEDVDWGLNTFERNKIKDLINRFGFSLVYDAAEISIAKYFCNGSSQDWYNAFYKIGGICYNKKNDTRGHVN